MMKGEGFYRVCWLGEVEMPFGNAVVSEGISVLEPWKG